ncbi:MAG: hypothetical protein QXP77_00280 [Candidatus Aenigmatarchaeota archaeon]
MKQWLIFIAFLALISFLFDSISFGISLIREPIDWVTVLIFGVLLVGISEIYIKLEEKFGWKFVFVFFLVSFPISFLIIEVLDLESIKYVQFFENFFHEIFKYGWLMVGFGVGAAIADQILHWILFGRKKSTFTLPASMSGILLDEVLFRLFFLGILIAHGLDICTALFIQALSYVIYYLDPFSGNRRRMASLNFIHGIINGVITLKFGWIISLMILYMRNFLWFLESKLSK